MLDAAGVSVGRRELRSDRSGYYTACYVLAGVVQATRHIALNFSQCTVAVEGFGNVGILRSKCRKGDRRRPGFVEFAVSSKDEGR